MAKIYTGWLRNRKPEPETGTVGTVFPETESGTGTAGTVFQEPKPEPEPPFPVKLYCNTEKPFLQRNRRNRKPEPREPFHLQTVTEPNRTGASLHIGPQLANSCTCLALAAACPNILSVRSIALPSSKGSFKKNRLNLSPDPQTGARTPIFSSGASGGSLHGGASFRVEKACEVADLLEPPKPRQIKSSSKGTKK